MIAMAMECVTAKEIVTVKLVMHHHTVIILVLVGVKILDQHPVQTHSKDS
jgi:hypothetical protein